jgi:hypothetical protein
MDLARYWKQWRHAGHLVEIDGRKVAITNREKPMYPSGFTKGQVVEYCGVASAFSRQASCGFVPS